jgi:hypothetical protein
MSVYTNIEAQYKIDLEEYPGFAKVPFGELGEFIAFHSPAEKRAMRAFINDFLVDKCRLIGIRRNDRVEYKRLTSIHYTDMVKWAKTRYNKFVKPLIQSQYKRLEDDMITVIMDELKRRNPFLKVNKPKHKIAKKVVKRTLKRYLLSLLADNVWWNQTFNLPFLTARHSHEASKIARMLLDYDTDFRPFTEDSSVKDDSVYSRCSMFYERDICLAVNDSTADAYEKAESLLRDATSYYEIITTYIEHYDALKTK